MLRNFGIATLAALLCGLGACGSGANAKAQDVVTTVSVSNRNPFPILVKRVGLEDDDQAVAEVRANDSVSFNDIPFNSGQVFIAFRLDGSKECIGAQPVTMQTASQNRVTLIVSERSIGAALAKKGGGSPGGNGRPPGNPNNGELFARNLGIHYRPIRKPDGTFVARITRPPAAGTPAGQLGFEPGDEIFAMDDQPFREPKDVLEHTMQTTVDFIDVNTKERRRATVELP